MRSYLKAVEATNSDDPKTVLAKMRETRQRRLHANGKLRPDGRMVHDVYLVQIKSPAESKGEWDLLKLVATIPGDKASGRWGRVGVRRSRSENLSGRASAGSLPSGPASMRVAPSVKRVRRSAY